MQLEPVYRLGTAPSGSRTPTRFRTSYTSAARASPASGLGGTDIGVFDDSHELQDVLAHRVGVGVEGAVVQDGHELPVIQVARLVPTPLLDQVVQPDLVFRDKGCAAGDHAVGAHLVGQ